MHPRTTYLLWPSAALSLLAGCLVEPTPELEPPLSLPGVELELKGRLVNASGTAAPFVPVRLGGPGGPIVATDPDGAFAFPELEAGQHTVYAYDRFDNRIGFVTIDLSAEREDDVTTVTLVSCNDVLGGWPTPDDLVVLDICISYDGAGVDLPPATASASLDALELLDGTGYTNLDNTGADYQIDFGSVREVFFGIHDGLARGGVREFTIVDHNLVGSDPVVDPSEDPVFGITIQDANGHQYYAVRDGVFRLEIEEGDGPTRSYVLTGTSLVLDYGDIYTFDPAYTLTVPSVRLEGTLDVDLPPPAPEGDITLALEAAAVFANYTPGQELLNISVHGLDTELVSLLLDPTHFALPGTVTVELPIGDVPDLTNNVLSMRSADGVSFWDFQLVSYTVTTNMTELPECDGQLTLTLENLVFRYVGWDYDDNSDRVDSFGDELVTIDRIDADVILDPSSGC